MTQLTTHYKRRGTGKLNVCHVEVLLEQEEEARAGFGIPVLEELR